MDKILIIDFGSQVTQLIARRIREINVYCEIYSCNVTIEAILKFAPKGIILSGGPNSVYDSSSLTVSDKIYSLGIPILGICYGMQLMVSQLCGQVTPAKNREFGLTQLYNYKSILFDEVIPESQNNAQLNLINVWMSHGDLVSRLPDGFATIASSQSCEYSAISDQTRKLYGVQFHPEVTHTPQGLLLIKNFVFKICQCRATWFIANIVDNMILDIKNKVANDKVILALSGGVDSTVAGLLIKKAIANNLICIFVDTGLLRYNEATNIMTMYQKLNINLIKIDAKEEFYNALKGIVDPELKRKIIGKLFIEIFEREAKKIPNAKYLAQGTIYPDVIESAAADTQTAHNIKSHHNVGGLPESLSLQLLEPLRYLFKDEVRNLGLILGLPEIIIKKHPYPGPGLAVRIIGEVTQEFIKILQLADHIFIEALIEHNYYDKISQAFAVFLPIKTVGVMGDARTYQYMVSLRAVNTVDFMTAEVTNLPHEFLTYVANKIINEVSGINKVVYDISGKPPSTIEWE